MTLTDEMIEQEAKRNPTKGFISGANYVRQQMQGQVDELKKTIQLLMPEPTICYKCNGTKYVDNRHCDNCKGIGKVIVLPMTLTNSDITKAANEFANKKNISGYNTGLSGVINHFTEGSKYARQQMQGEVDVLNKTIQTTQNIINAVNKPSGYLTCPFCKEPDFDAVGLKYHLERYCKTFDETLTK